MIIMYRKLFGIKRLMGMNLKYLYDIQLRLQEVAFSQTIEQPKVSIIIPTYNNEKYLSKCLFSLVEQTLKEIEIIVVNDGSSDSTSSILRIFEEYDSRIRVIAQPHLKQGAARNNGTKYAKGEYIGFVDSDDWVDLDYFEKLYNAAKKYNSDIALATNVRVGGKKKPKKRLDIKEELFIENMQDKFSVSKALKNSCPTNKIYKLEFLKKNNIIWPEKVFYEDKIFVAQTVYYANGIVCVPNVYYYYFRNPSSTVNTKGKKYLEELNNDKNNAKLSVIEFLQNKKVNLEYVNYWATIHQKKLLGFPIYTVKKSLYSRLISIIGIPLFKIKSIDYKRVEFSLGKIKLKYKRNDWLKQANNLNISLKAKNIKVPYKQNNRNILFIASRFVSIGGIETRLEQYLNLLSKNGWGVFLLSEENTNERLLKYSNFHLNFDAPNFHNCLSELIDVYRINVIEFQFKNPKILKNINLDSLKEKAKVGCTIHNTGVNKLDLINRFDYKIFVSEQMYSNYYRKVKNPTIIKNGICLNNVNKEWNYCGQNKALLVSRISKDKLTSIECFIKYCQKQNIDFDIAGVEQTKNKLLIKLKKKYKLKASQFIGKVDTVEYLKTNINKYLFVGGVGLVILEAGSLNYPCFVCSDYKGQNFSFVTNENIALFDNFTIKSHHSISKQKKMVHLLEKSKLQDYAVKEFIINQRNINTISKKYIEVLDFERSRFAK